MAPVATSAGAQPEAAPKSVQGADPDWLFLRSEIQLHYGPWAPSERHEVEAGLARARARLETLHAEWCEPWRRFVLCFVPDKSCVARRHLFLDVGSAAPEPWRPAAAVGLPLLGDPDLLPEDYQPSDTHIGPSGGVVCARQLASLLDVPFAEPRETVMRLQGPGDLADARNAGDEIWRRFAGRSYEVAWPVSGTDWIDRTCDLPLRYRLSQHRPSRWLVARDRADDDDDAPRVLLYGGSSCFHYIAPFAVPPGGELLFVWNHGCYAEDLLRWYRPTHVAAVLTERFSRSVAVLTTPPAPCPELVSSLGVLSVSRRLATLLARGLSVDFDAYHLLTREDVAAAELDAVLLRIPPQDWATEQEGDLAEDAVASSLKYVNLYEDLFELYAGEAHPSLEVCTVTGELRAKTAGAGFPNLAAAAHFMRAGRLEGRVLRLCPEAEALDVEERRAQRADLAHLTDRQLRAHYHHEGRWGR